MLRVDLGFRYVYIYMKDLCGMVERAEAEGEKVAMVFI